MPKPLILITEPIATEPSSWLSEHCDVLTIKTDDAGFSEALNNAQGLVVRTYTQVDQAFLGLAPNLKVIARAGVGLDNIDLPACTNRGIRVVHTPHANAMAVVEYTISMIMQTLRPIHRITAPLTNDQWHDARQAAITPDSVVNTPLGIIGLGHIGSRVARATSALGMTVRYTDLRTIDTPQTNDATFQPPQTLNTLLKQSRVICVHVDGRAENKGLIAQAQFDQMRSDVIFINASRGFVVDPDSAASFAKANPAATMILDVHDPEPIDQNSPLLNLDNVILTPHIAAATREAKTAMSWVVRDVWAVLSGREPVHPAN